MVGRAVEERPRIARSIAREDYNADVQGALVARRKLPQKPATPAELKYRFAAPARIAPEPEPELEPLSLGDDPEAAATRELIKRLGFHEFIREFWEIADPAAKFVDNWHIGAIAEHLQAISAGQIRDLVISLPPRHGKSVVTATLWPAWHWVEREAKFNWLFASYDINLCIRDAQRMHELFKSTKFRRVYPDWTLRPGLPAFKSYRNAFQGRRMGTSPDSKATGHGSHIQVVDDPLKPDDAASKTESRLKKIQRWYGSTMSSRIDGDPEAFRRVVIMQRLHEADLAGHCLDQGFQHLCIPFRHVEKVTWDRGSSLNFQDPRKKIGETIHKKMWPEAAAQRLEKAMSSPSAIAAQLQQDPTPKSGGFVERQWFRKFWTPPKAVFHV